MIRLAIRVPAEHAELVLADLLELAPAGLEEVELEGGVVEYALYGASGELPELGVVRAHVGEALLDVQTREIADDWSERWREFHRPVLVQGPGDRSLYVRPPWEPPCEPDEAIDIVIDPAQAFGTGSHHTTRLCLELTLVLRAEDPRELSLLDIGTGSGVLAIAASKLGFRSVCALDNDPESISAARENAFANNAAIDLERLDVRSDPLPSAGPETVILANLLRPLLLALADRLVRPPAHLIAGGLLIGELDEISEAFRERLGLRERERRHSGEWGSLWLTGSRDGGLDADAPPDCA